MQKSNFTASFCFVSLQTQDAKGTVVVKFACHAENASQVPDSLRGICYRGHRACDPRVPQCRDRILKSSNQTPALTTLTTIITNYTNYSISQIHLFKVNKSSDNHQNSAYLGSLFCLPIMFLCPHDMLFITFSVNVSLKYWISFLYSQMEVWRVCIF